MARALPQGPHANARVFYCARNNDATNAAETFDKERVATVLQKYKTKIASCVAASTIIEGAYSGRTGLHKNISLPFSIAGSSGMSFHSSNEV